MTSLRSCPGRPNKIIVATLILIAVFQLNFILLYRSDESPLAPQSPLNMRPLAPYSSANDHGILSPSYTCHNLQLPAISCDNSELILSSIIERSSNTEQFQVTIFMLNAAMVLSHGNRRSAIREIHMSFKDQWTDIVGRMSRVKYASSGRRAKVSYYCRILHSLESKSYVVLGEFVATRPNRGEPATGSPLDILHCFLKAPIPLTASVAVQIMRENRSIGQFSIPSKHHRTGYLMTPPVIDGHSENSSYSDKLKLSSGPHVRTRYEHASLENDIPGEVHLCVVGTDQLLPGEAGLHRLAEFIEYHKLLGVHHMYFACHLMPDSSAFRAITTFLKSYVSAELVSITSTAENRGFRNIDSVLGIQFRRATVETIWINSCLYMAKGVADYLAVWNINEFIIPVPPFHSVMTVIRGAERRRDTEGERDIVNALNSSRCVLPISSVKKYSRHRESTVNDLTKIYSFDNDPVGDDHSIRFILNTRMEFQGIVDSHCLCCLTSGDDGHSDSISCLQMKDYKSNPGLGGVHLNYEGYLYHFLAELPKNTRKRGERSLVFKDDVAKQLLLRAEYIVRERLAGRDRHYLPAGDMLHSEEFGGRKWKVYNNVFRPNYELSEGIRKSEVKELSVDEIWKIKSKNGYLNLTHTSRAAHGMSASALPAFASDNSDVALSAVIEREHNSWNLYVTTFFMHHELFNADEGYGITRIERDKIEQWRAVSDAFSRTKYSKSGVRKNAGRQLHRCRIKASANDVEYEVKGEFMPSKLSADSNANSKLDIFRCKMTQSKEKYELYAGGSQEHIEVFIIDSNNISLFHYSIPWESRRVGYLVSSPKIADSFRPWKAFRRNSSHKPGEESDSLHMSVPGIESPVSQKTLPMYLEFMQHHFLVGVQHMFAAGPYAWGGRMMSDFIMSTKPFIDDHLLTVASQAGDNIDLLYSVLGASLDRDVVKVMFVNMCLYLAKGMVDYLAVWDIDEYFIPRPPHHTIMDVVRAAESPHPLLPLPPSTGSAESRCGHVRGQPGWADGRCHPFCYLVLSSEVIFSSLGYPEVYAQEKPWVGFKYDHLPETNPASSRYAFKKTIIPTGRIFQAGLHLHGTCVLGKKWRTGVRAKNSSALHLPESKGVDSDFKRIPPSDAAIFHFQMHRSYEKANVTSLYHKKNQYALDFFPSVLKELTKKGLNALVTLPDNAPIVATADIEWLSLNESMLLSDDRSDVLSKNGREQPVSFLKLPSFSGDFSESVLGSILERSFGSRDMHVTTFLLCHTYLLAENSNSAESHHAFEPQRSSKWLQFRSWAKTRRYSETGIRSNGHNFYCKITNFYGGQSYKVKGYFMPNKLSVDSNANSKVDILRCPMRKSKYSIDDLSGSKFAVSVEIFRGKKCLIKFRVPWKTRRAGYMLSAPSEMSRLDMWKGLSKRGAQAGEEGDSLHLSVPGFESPMTKTSLAVYAEFLQHHHNLGVQHVHAAAAYKWGEINMDLFSQSLQSYIDEGFLSIASLSHDEDRVPGWLGLSIDRDVVKVMFVNMCLYLAKGMVDYLAVWDIDEYFIPRPPHHTIMDVVRAAESPHPLQPLPSNSDPFRLVHSWSGGRGWADGDGHPFCYLRLQSETIFRSSSEPQKPSPFSPWIGNRYRRGPENDQSLNFEKSILPTKRIFQAGLHTGAGCKLDPPFTGCEKNTSQEFCMVDKHAQKYGYTILRDAVNGRQTNVTDFSFEQRLDGFIFNKDAKTVDSISQGVMYHIQIHREELVSDTVANAPPNDYVQRLYPSVLRNLRRRGIELKVIIPGMLRNKGVDIDKMLGWVEFDNG